jgi:acyl-CoA oxidase
MLAATRGKKLAPGVAYLGQPGILTSKSDGSLSLADIQRAWQCVAANVIKRSADEYVGLLKSGKKKDEAMEQCSQARFVAAKVHTVNYIFNMYKEAVEEMDAQAQETKVLATVCRLYGLWQVEEMQGYFVRCASLHTDAIRKS